MQTITQTTAGAQTVQFNITGKYFTILATNNGLNVRFYNGGKQKELGTISGLLAGLEVSFNLDGDSFDRVEVDTLGADTFTIGIGNGQARYNRSQGNVAITNTPAVTISGNSNANPLFTTDLITTYGASYKSNTALAANTPDTVFTPAANVNGAIILTLSFSDYSASVPLCSFLAKNAAPANNIDGDIILQTDVLTSNGTSSLASASLKKPIKIAAGKGLYFISPVAETGALRSANYILL